MINLLPPEQRARNTRASRERRMIALIVSCAAFFIALFLSLLFVTTYLDSEIAVADTLLAEARRESALPENMATRKQIRELNRDMSDILSSFRERTELAPAIRAIIKAFPTTMTATEISYEQSARSFIIRGIAPTRETLLDFKTLLEEEPSFTDISFPPSNWVQPADIDFFVTFHYE